MRIEFTDATGSRFVLNEPASRISCHALISALDRAGEAFKTASVTMSWTVRVRERRRFLFAAFSGARSRHGRYMSRREMRAWRRRELQRVRA